MAANRIRKGDEVVVLTGKNRNARGTVMRVLATMVPMAIQGVILGAGTP